MPGREPTISDYDGATYRCTLHEDAPGHLTYRLHADLLRTGSVVLRACRWCHHPLLRLGDGRTIDAQLCSQCDFEPLP